MFDTHCHPYLLKTHKSEEIISSFKLEGGDYLVSIGIDIETSIKSIKLARKHKQIFATIGISPTDSLAYKGKLKETIDTLEKLYLENKEIVVGIGECGLDYHWIPSLVTESINEQTIKEIQKEFFIAQIKLAKKHNLPVIIHNREAKDDTLKILKQENYKNFIFHCFSEDIDFAKKCIEFSPNCKISFSGIVTFNSAKAIQETAQKIPLKNIIVETDSPYLTPVPYRGKQENKPEFVKYVLEKIAELRNEKLEAVEKEIMKNSLEVFKIKK